jgi:hypothetical protein
VTFWLRCLIPIHLTVKYATPHDRCDDAGLRLDVTIEEGLVEFLDDFREGLGGRWVSPCTGIFTAAHTCRSLTNDTLSEPSSSVIIFGTNLFDR